MLVDDTIHLLIVLLVILGYTVAELILSNFLDQVIVRGFKVDCRARSLHELRWFHYSFHPFSIQMEVWIILLALVVFLAYMWQSGWMTPQEDKPGCNTCPGKKNLNVI